MLKFSQQQQQSLFLLICCSLLSTLTWGARNGPWYVPATLTTIIKIRGGSDEEANVVGAQEASRPAVSVRASSSDSYMAQLESAKSKVLQACSATIEELRRKIVDQAVIVENFGAKADKICNQAVEEFAKTAPSPPQPQAKRFGGADDATAAAAAYDRQLEELEAALDSPLQVLYLRQLALLREQALQRYRSAVAKTTGTTAAADYEAMLQADAQFARDAKASTREGSDWDYTSDRSHLQSVMNSIAESAKRSIELQLKSAQQQQTAMQFLQGQQQMIQQLQMQLYGQTSPWNVGVAYRIPDTNFNLQGSYQQGRANLQLSCVPDEYAPMLGPNGFTNGVGPGNLGLSLNLSI